MAYEFIDYLKPAGTAKFALLEDLYLKGGFRVVQFESDRDSLDPTTLKRGMFVKCLDSGITYRLVNIVRTEDEYGDIQTSLDWEEFKFSHVDDSLTRPPELYKLSHANFTVNIANLGDGKYLSLSKNLGCFSFMLFNVRTSKPCKLELHSRADYKDTNPYTFKSRFDHLVDTGLSKVFKREEFQFDLKTGAYNIICNEDDELSYNFYFKIFKVLSLTQNKSVGDGILTVAFDYIPIEL